VRGGVPERRAGADGLALIEEAPSCTTSEAEVFSEQIPLEAEGDAALPDASTTSPRESLGLGAEETPDVVGEAQLVVTYLTGAMEGLIGQAGGAPALALDPTIADLALEKLQYFGEILHLLAEATAVGVTGQPDLDGVAAPSQLQVRLERRTAGRIALRCFDDGRFFRRVLQKVRLDTEALRPLVLAVIRAGGSVCLRRGGWTGFGITG